MFKSIKKGVTLASKKATDYVNNKVKEEVEEKINAYKNKVVSVLWVQFLYIFAFILISLGIIHFFSNSYPKEYVLIIAGVIILLIGWFIGKKN
jgi:cytochrome c biogenesis protein CcdA